MKNFFGFLCCILISSQLMGLSWLVASAGAASTSAMTDTIAGTEAAGVAMEGATDDEYCGEYFLPSGKRISVYMKGIIREMARLTFINWENGRVGELQNDGQDRYWAAGSLVQPD